MSIHDELNAMLTELAIARDEAAPIIQAAKDAIAEANVQIILPQEGIISDQETRLKEMEAAIRQRVLDYVAETGDLAPHPSIEFRRTTKLMYDPETVKAELVANGAGTEVVKTETKLYVREFEKGARAGKFPYASFEEVPAPTVAIRALGELLYEAKQ